MIANVSFFAIFFALVIEQARPLHLQHLLFRGASNWVAICARNLDAGRAQHGWLYWTCAVLAPAAMAWLIHLALQSLLGWFGFVLAFLWSVVVLYFTLGFRQFSHHFSAIRQALDEGETAKAAELLAEWKQMPAAQDSQEGLVQALMEHATLAAHKHVLGMLVWYVALAALGLGPAGAIIYYLAGFVSKHPYGAQLPDFLERSSSKRCAELAWHWVDYGPARVTALAFAVVGNFEEVMEAWRARSAESPVPGLSNDALVVVAMTASLTLQNNPRPEHLRSLVGLVWRAVVLLLLLIALLSIARLLG